jgi:hypothetical protein
MLKAIAVVIPLAVIASLLSLWLYRHSPRRASSTAGSQLARDWRAWRGSLPSHRAASLVVLASAIAIRLFHLPQPLRYDEAFTYLNYASHSLVDVLSDYSLPNNHVFHTLLVWVTTRILGHQPWEIRLTAFLAGVCLVIAVYVVARRFANADAALLAAALAATLPSLILYSTNARGYSLIGLAFVVLIWHALALAEEDSGGLWLGLAATVALGMYTAPSMIYPAGAVCVWILVDTIRRQGRGAALAILPRFAVAIALAGVLTVAAYVPILLRSGLAALLSNSGIPALPYDEFLAALPAFVDTLAPSLALGIPTAVLVLLAAVAAYGALADPAERGRRASLLVVVLAWSVLTLFESRRLPPARVWLFLVPLLCIYAGAGLAALAARASSATRIAADRLSIAASLGLATVLGIQTIASRAVFDATETGTLVAGREIARELLAQRQRGDDVVVARPSGAVLDYYLIEQRGQTLAEFNRSGLHSRLRVVVNERHGQTLAAIMRLRRDLAWREFTTTPTSLSFTGARLYTFERTRPGR